MGDCGCFREFVCGYVRRGWDCACEGYFQYWSVVGDCVGGGGVAVRSCVGLMVWDGGWIADVVVVLSLWRGFFVRVGGVVMGLVGACIVGVFVLFGEVEVYYFCGYIYMIDLCLYFIGFLWIDVKGYLLCVKDGCWIDDFGCYVDAVGNLVGEDGCLLMDVDGVLLLKVSCTCVCMVVVGEYGFTLYIDGVWYCCCGGYVRKFVDCCGYVYNWINGDCALMGYCYYGWKVFCVMYYDMKVKC